MIMPSTPNEILIFGITLEIVEPIVAFFIIQPQALHDISLLE